MRSQHCRQTLISAWGLTLVSLLCVLPVLVFGGSIAGHAQVADRLSEVKNIYVDSFGTGHGAIEIREQVIRRLQRSRDIQIVPEPKEAEAEETK